MNTQKSNFLKQKGYSAIEIMIAVVLIGIVLAFVVPMLTGVKDKNVTVNQEFGAMQRTVTQIYDRYFNEIIEDSNVNNSEVIAGRLQSEAYRHNGTDKIYNIFGGEIDIEGVAENGLTFTSNRIPKNVCASLVNMTRGKLPFETVDIAGTAITFSDAGSINAINNACEAVTGDSLTITWTKEGA